MSHPPEPQPSERVPRIVIAAAGLAAVITVAVGLTIHATSGKLGTASPPFVLGWRPAVDWAWLIAALVASAAVGLLASLFLDPERFRGGAPARPGAPSCVGAGLAPPAQSPQAGPPPPPQRRPPQGTDLIDLASWTVVASVMLNLDEMFLKR